jgi:hypothetical protein
MSLDKSGICLIIFDFMVKSLQLEFLVIFRMLSEGVEIVLNERKVYEVDWLEDSYKRVKIAFNLLYIFIIK